MAQSRIVAGPVTKPVIKSVALFAVMSLSPVSRTTAAPIYSGSSGSLYVVRNHVFFLTVCNDGTPRENARPAGVRTDGGERFVHQCQPSHRLKPVRGRQECRAARAAAGRAAAATIDANPRA